VFEAAARRSSSILAFGEISNAGVEIHRRVKPEVQRLLLHSAADLARSVAACAGGLQGSIDPEPLAARLQLSESKHEEDGVA
jgi:predicted protein tyrosine phosphatase